MFGLPKCETSLKNQRILWIIITDFFHRWESICFLLVVQVTSGSYGESLIIFLDLSMLWWRSPFVGVWLLKSNGWHCLSFVICFVIIPNYSFAWKVWSIIYFHGNGNIMLFESLLPRTILPSTTLEVRANFIGIYEIHSACTACIALKQTPTWNKYKCDNYNIHYKTSCIRLFSMTYSVNVGGDLCMLQIL